MRAPDCGPQPQPSAHKSLCCHLDWGPEGVTEAVARGDIVVVVDVLRFSSTATAAVAAGMKLLPVDAVPEARLKAEELDLPLVRSSRGSPDPEQPTDSPLWYAEHGRPGAAAVYPSPNGARLTALAAGHPHVYAGAFLNSTAVARVAAREAKKDALNMTVIAAGERSTDFDPAAASRRLFAIEDYLAAGAIVAASGLSLSPDARVAATAWHGSRDDLLEILRSCLSGRWLIDSDRSEEVDYCAQVDAVTAVPMLRDGWVVGATVQGDGPSPADI